VDPHTLEPKTFKGQYLVKACSLTDIESTLHAKLLCRELPDDGTGIKKFENKEGIQNMIITGANQLKLSDVLWHEDSLIQNSYQIETHHVYTNDKGKQAESHKEKFVVYADSMETAQYYAVAVATFDPGLSMEVKSSKTVNYEDEIASLDFELKESKERLDEMLEA